MLLASNGGSSQKEYVDSLFSAYTYTGNGSTQTITNGIDLAGKGGLVWTKVRVANGGEDSHHLYDTTRGVGNSLQTNSTAAQANQGNSLTAFGNNGYTLGGLFLGTNGSPYTYVSWTFRKAPKFFDVVTYTGNGVAGRQIPHSLGIAPGVLVVKRTDTTGNWSVQHRGVAATQVGYLNSTSAFSAGGEFYNTYATSSVFTVSADANINANGGTYVAYLFAHDTSTD